MEHDGMSTSETPTDRDTAENRTGRQPRLPGITDVPLQFRLSAATCRVGLAGVAAAKRQLAEQAERRAAAEAARGRARGGQPAADQQAA